MLFPQMNTNTPYMYISTTRNQCKQMYGLGGDGYFVPSFCLRKDSNNSKILRPVNIKKPS